MAVANDAELRHGSGDKACYFPADLAYFSRRLAVNRDNHVANFKAAFFGWAARFDMGDQGPVDTAQAERLGYGGGDGLYLYADPAAQHVTAILELLNHELCGFRRDIERDAD